jgi:hypothetical protein
MTTEHMAQAICAMLEMNDAQRVYLQHMLQALRARTAKGVGDLDVYESWQRERPQ